MAAFLWKIELDVQTTLGGPAPFLIRETIRRMVLPRLQSSSMTKATPSWRARGAYRPKGASARSRYRACRSLSTSASQLGRRPPLWLFITLGPAPHRGLFPFFVGMPEVRTTDGPPAP